MLGNLIHSGHHIFFTTIRGFPKDFPRVLRQIPMQDEGAKASTRGQGDRVEEARRKASGTETILTAEDLREFTAIR